MIAVSACFVLSLALTVSSLKCPQLPVHNPTSVNDLHPNDIKVIAAIGDSITAGFGIMGLEGWLDEYRGCSWSIGADSGRNTVFNLLKHFNPNLIGGSVGYHFVEICYDEICPSPHEPAYDKLNGAQSGAYTQNLPDQVDYIVNQMINDPNIDYANDWKMLTILIGANNLCLSCFSDLSVFESANVYQQYLEQTLNKIQSKIPKVFVNILDIFNISQVYELSLQSEWCSDIHRGLPLECGCAFDPIDGAANRKKMDDMSVAYNERTRLVVSKLAPSKEFAVVIQPCFEDGKIPALSWLSTLDCFHPSLVAHGGMATALWNNMLSPSHLKKRYLDPNDVPMCPKNDTLLYTY
eukprot:TRINITY_DN19544_c0_g1_i1.p1 TRINITY_DN19544_c0_g1~~TRINITY_DN19544_c0_g1_i1.p1  ORF type:complete len:351 (+),score=86.50 TRINITY_DN19544_c0_g1_i1:1563-2615(+)